MPTKVFGNYFLFKWNLCSLLLKKAYEIKASQLKPIQVKAGLGDPPNEFTINDGWSGNFIRKYKLHFDKKNRKKF